LQKKKAKLEEYKKGVMQKLFSQEIRFKDENGNDFPDWEEKKLGEIGSFKNGVNKSKSDFGFGSPFVNLMNVFGKNSLDSNIKLDLVNVSTSEIENYNLLEGDVLFIRSSVKREGVGETIVVEENLDQTVYSGFLIRYRDSNYINKAYKKYCFGTPQFRHQLIAYSSSSANTNINQESLSKLIIKLPTISEQQKIASFLSSIDVQIKQVGKQIEQSQVFKKGLLQKMFV
jgi:type I restriction enzyme S subunit